MTSIQLRKKVTHFLEEKADDTLLKMIYAMMQAYEQEKEHEFHLSPKQWSEIERRSKELKTGKAKTISHPELMRNMKARLKAAKK
ncbi:hypothetical protein BH11BAC7_BH11BAC7_02680 [soil metagenome]